MAPTQDSIKDAEEDQNIQDDNSPRMVPCDAIKNEFLCAICLSILKKTVTSQECLHRFCQECIRTSLQISNQECPTCRAKLTESTLRSDPVFDNLIEKLFPRAESSTNQSGRNYFSISLAESQEKNHQPKSTSHETAKNNVFTITSSKGQEEIRRNNNITKESLDIPDDVYKYKITHADTKDSTAGENGKRKRTSSENNGSSEDDVIVLKMSKPNITTKEMNSNTKSINSETDALPSEASLTVKNDLATESRGLNIEQLQGNESQIPQKEAINKDGRKMKLKKSTPKRRSLRIEAIQLESDKNRLEIDYNRRLSNGAAQVFFSSLQLQPNNVETVTCSSCKYKGGLGSREEENGELKEDFKNHSILQPGKEDAELPEIQKEENIKVTEHICETITQKEVEEAEEPLVSNHELTLEKKVFSPEDESLTDVSSFVAQLNNGIEDGGQVYNEVIKNTSPLARDENSNVSGLILQKNIDEEGKRTPKTSQRRKIRREMAVTVRRSERFAAFMANEHIQMQTASRRRTK